MLDGLSSFLNQSNACVSSLLKAFGSSDGTFGASCDISVIVT